MNVHARHALAGRSIDQPAADTVNRDEAEGDHVDRLSVAGSIHAVEGDRVRALTEDGEAKVGPVAIVVYVELLVAAVERVVGGRHVVGPVWVVDLEYHVYRGSHVPAAAEIHASQETAARGGRVWVGDA